MELFLIDPGDALKGCVGEDAFVVFQEAFRIVFVKEGEVAFEDCGNIFLRIVLF